MSSLILASASPRRQEILRSRGYLFRVHPATVDEIDEDVFPGRVPLRNAQAKATAVATLFPSDLVLGADTVIECERQILGKPSDLADARRILSLLSGRTHEVVTAVALLRLVDHTRCVFCARTAVTFHPLSAAVIDDYLTRVNVLDKAGAYAIQEYGEMLVANIDGPLDNVIGLPGDKTAAALARCRVRPGA